MSPSVRGIPSEGDNRFQSTGHIHGRSLAHVVRPAFTVDKKGAAIEGQVSEFKRVPAAREKGGEVRAIKS